MFHPQLTYMIFIRSPSCFHIFIFIYFIIIGYITNSQLTIYPCCLVAQWIEHCTGIAKSWARIPFKPELFFQVAFSTAYVDSTLRGSNFTHVSSAVHIYDFHIFIFIYFTIIGYIRNSQLTIFTCDLVTQWIEHCTGIARSWVRIAFKPEFCFFSGCFFNCLS